MANILLKNVNTIDRPANKSTCIGIKDDIILFINEQLPADFIPDTTINCENKLATSGFINTHTHAAMVLFRSYADDMQLMDWLQNKIWPIEAKLSANDIYWGSMLAICEMLKSGTTTFADMYFFMNETAKAVEQTGIRAVLARGLAGDDSSDDTKILENAQLFKDWHNEADGRITVMFGPHAPYTCSKKFIQRVITQAKKLDAGIHIHLSETKGEVENCVSKYGKTPIEHMNDIGLFECPTIAAHCVFITDEEISLMSEKGVSVAHNPQSNLKLASGVAPVDKMLKNGIVLGLGTDGASSNNNLDMYEEMRLVSMLHKGISNDPLVITAKESFEMATINGAKALKLNKIGSIEAGYKADIVLYDIDKPHWQPKFNLCNNFVYAGGAGDVDTVIIDGKILLQKGTLLTIDEERVKYEIGECVKTFIK